MASVLGSLLFWESFANHDKAGLNGRVGHGDEMDRLAPRVVETLLGKDVRGIACGAAHTAAWNGAGALFTWGAGQGRLGHDHERGTSFLCYSGNRDPGRVLLIVFFNKNNCKTGSHHWRSQRWAGRGSPWLLAAMATPPPSLVEPMGRMGF